MMAGLKPCATPNLSRRSAEGAKADQKKTRRLLSVGGLLNLVRFAGYASSAHTPPTRLVPFDGTRFRPFDRLRVVPSVVEGRVIGLVVRANIVNEVYERDSQFVNDPPTPFAGYSFGSIDLHRHGVVI